MIYFGRVECGHVRPLTGSQMHKVYLIKIGQSIRPLVREKELQAGSDSDFKVLAIMDGGPAEEAALHARFSYARMPGMSRKAPELFYPVAELMRLIGSLKDIEAARKGVEDAKKKLEEILRNAS